MNKQLFLVVDTETEFAERFKERLEIIKLNNKYEIVNVVPNTRKKHEIIDDTLEKIRQYHEKNISAIFVDIVVIESGTKLDTTGTLLGNTIKTNFPNIPVYNITSKVLDDKQLDILSEATMENNNGVFTKSFLEGEKLNHARIEKIVNRPFDFFMNDDMKSKKNDECQVAIITAIYDDEFENIKRVFNLTDKDEDEIKIYHKGFSNLQCKDGNERQFKIVACHQHKTGMVDAAIFATEIITKYKPKTLIITGVCGGKNGEKIRLGDVVFASKLFIYEKGKVEEDAFYHESESIDTNEKILQLVKENKTNLLRKVMDDDLSRKHRYETHPLNLFIEPMACSFSVINREGFFEEKIQVVDRKTISVDMESYAVARACRIANSNATKSIIIKSIMDKTKGKDDEVKSFAAFTSALFLKHLICEVLYEII